MKPQIILLFIIGLMFALGSSSCEPDPQFELRSQSPWNTYTSSKYNFEISYPPDWKHMEITDSGPQGVLDQILFSRSTFPPASTGAKADFHLFITQDNPTGNWQSTFFDNYLAEEIHLGNVPARKISGINKESHYKELVVIAKLGDYYLQAMPNFSSESMEYFDRIIASLQFNTPIFPSPATDPPPTLKPGEVKYEWFSFYYDASLAERVTIQTVPSYRDPSGFIFNDIPEHVRFDFVNPYTGKEPFANYPPRLMPWQSHQNPEDIELVPQIFIFSTKNFSDISFPAAERIKELEEMLNAENIPGNSDLPVLPLFNSTQDIRAQRQYLEFNGGRGIRFITRYSQEAGPVTNPTFFYTFQGLTENGEYYISAFFPIHIPSLPNRIEIKDWDVFNQHYRTYLINTTESLEQMPLDVQPDLATLDAVIQSIAVLPAQVNSYPPPELFSTKSTSNAPYPESKSNSTQIGTTAQSLCQDQLFEPIAFLPDNNNLLGKTNTGIGILNLKTGEEKSYLEVPNQIVEAAISNDGQSVALALDNHNIYLADSRHASTFEAHTNFITALEFSPNGDKLFSASHDNWVKIWDREGNLIASLLPGGLEVLGIGISPDGTKLATISFEGPMKLWDIGRNQVIQEFESPYGAFDGADAAFSPDGQILGRGIGGGPITLYKVSDGSQLWSGGVYALAFSPDGKFLAVSDIDADGENSIVLRSQDGTEAYTMLRGHKSMILKLIFSPDSSLLVSVDDLGFKVWQVDNGQLLYSRNSPCP